MKPYKNLKSKNLGILLFVARFTAFIGIIGAIVSIVLVVANLFGPVMVVGLALILPFAFGTISIFFISGIMAAIVGFEENYRLRTECYLSSVKP